MPWHEVVLALLLVVALIAGGFFFLRHRASQQASNAAASSPVGSVPEKSIAVLPFENLSEEKANAFFTDGVQDEILTDLSKIADLKVISRTSRHAVQERRAAQSARDRPATRRGACRRRQCAARGQQSAGESRS